MPYLKNKIFKIKKQFNNSRIIRKISDFYEFFFNIIPTDSTKPTEKGWSIVVITSGKSNQALSELVKSAENELTDTRSEIIIVGPKSSRLNFQPKIKVRFFYYKELGLAPGWITRKKNIGVKLCKYDKVAVCHDYIIFTPGWLAGYEKFGDDFNVCTNKIVSYDGSRFRDWIVWDYPGIGPGLLPYEIECSQYQMLNGTYFVVKKSFYLNNLLDEKLRWGEGEDVEWSLRIREITKFKLNLNSIVTFSKVKNNVSGNWLENTKKLEKIFTKK